MSVKLPNIYSQIKGCQLNYQLIALYYITFFKLDCCKDRAITRFSFIPQLIFNIRNSQLLKRLVRIKNSGV